MKSTLSRPTSAALSVLIKHQGNETSEKLLRNLQSRCHGAPQRSKTVGSDVVHEHNTQVRIEKNMLTCFTGIESLTDGEMRSCMRRSQIFTY